MYVYTLPKRALNYIILYTPCLLCPHITLISMRGTPNWSVLHPAHSYISTCIYIYIHTYIYTHIVALPYSSEGVPPVKKGREAGKGLGLQGSGFRVWVNTGAQITGIECRVQDFRLGA